MSENTPQESTHRIYSLARVPTNNPPPMGIDRNMPPLLASSQIVPTVPLTRNPPHGATAIGFPVVEPSTIAHASQAARMAIDPLDRRSNPIKAHTSSASEVISLIGTSTTSEEVRPVFLKPYPNIPARSREIDSSMPPPLHLPARRLPSNATVPSNRAPTTAMPNVRTAPFSLARVPPEGVQAAPILPYTTLQRLPSATSMPIPFATTAAVPAPRATPISLIRVRAPQARERPFSLRREGPPGLPVAPSMVRDHVVSSSTPSTATPAAVIPSSLARQPLHIATGNVQTLVRAPPAPQNDQPAMTHANWSTTTAAAVVPALVPPPLSLYRRPPPQMPLSSIRRAAQPVAREPLPRGNTNTSRDISPVSPSISLPVSAASVDELIHLDRLFLYQSQAVSTGDALPLDACVPAIRQLRPTHPDLLADNVITSDSDLPWLSPQINMDVLTLNGESEDGPLSFTYTEGQLLPIHRRIFDVEWDWEDYNERLAVFATTRRNQLLLELEHLQTLQRMDSELQKAADDLRKLLETM